MPIDPAGTTPGLAPGAQPEEKVHMRCRNTGRCDSMVAVIMKIPGHEAMRMYRCTECNHTWGINIGGAVNL